MNHIAALVDGQSRQSWSDDPSGKYAKKRVISIRIVTIDERIRNTNRGRNYHVQIAVYLPVFINES